MILAKVKTEVGRRFVGKLRLLLVLIRQVIRKQQPAEDREATRHTLMAIQTQN